jgi:predicted alpha/beta hydrolase family esterase
MRNTVIAKSERAGKTGKNRGVRLADLRVLVVPGLHGSGPDHWQSRWQRLYPAFERVEQDYWDTPDLPVWSQRLHEVVQRNARPTLIVAHSFGCLTTAHLAVADAGTLVGALLVAPADPVKFNVADAVRFALPFPTIVVGSGDDPWMTAARAEHWAQAWGSEFVHAGDLGHINAESGLGDWVGGQGVLGQLLGRVAGSRGLRRDS